jgi:uncharacterized metal-binding protein YceD (DUF177 family)
MTVPSRFPLADASIRIDSMPPEGRDLHIAAAEEERAAIAEHLGITSIERLDVRLHAVRFKGGIRVTGHLKAEIVQPSVVSLEPVSQSISEPIDRVFLPAGEKDHAAPTGVEIFIDLEGADVPDHFVGAEADLSDLVVETLSLAIDPYPRAEGETVADLGVATDEEPPESPFAALKQLKDSGDEGS